MEYGLIGEKLSHSFSKEIHEALGGYGYELHPLPPDGLEGFFRAREFRGINVTIPYKRDVIPFLDEIDPRAEAIGAVNTIVNREGRLTGYNTDYDGFRMTLEQNRIDPAGKSVLILGNGGVCRTVKAVLRELGAAELLVASRRPGPDTLSYHDALHHGEVSIVVNASPVGMSPDTEGQPVNLAHFPRLEAAVDLIYNPLRTRFLQQAEELGAAAPDGLLMLVAQAASAVRLFTGREVPAERVLGYAAGLRRGKCNLVLTGMPGSGKSTVGRLLAERTGRSFVDTDALVEEKAGIPIPEIFRRFGEAEFRRMEAETVREISLKGGLVVATGGGVPMNGENVSSLRQNGLVVFLDRPLELLEVGNGRPLSRTREDTRALYEKRILTYRRSCDVTLDNGGTPEEAAGKIERELERFCGRLAGEKTESSERKISTT